MTKFKKDSFISLSFNTSKKISYEEYKKTFIDELTEEEKKFLVQFKEKNIKYLSDKQIDFLKRLAEEIENINQK